MQYKLLAVSALVGAAVAAPEKRQIFPTETEDFASIVSVLETAVPSSLIAEAATDTAAASADLASQFANGQTPAWFTSLPSDIQSYLMPTPANATTGRGTGVSGYPYPSGNNSTLLNTSSRMSLTSSASLSTSTSSSSSASASSASASAGSSSTSSGGASMPTAILGLSFAGVAGLVGVLAL